MGTYLSTPITEKGEESGESLECPEIPCRWGVVDMQGWRKSMEDAHVAVTDIALPAGKSDAKVFGVFDGHGGAEVARFVALYLVSVLTQQSSWTEAQEALTQLHPENAVDAPVGNALRATFHALDRMIDDPSRRAELHNLKTTKPYTGERRDADSIPPVKPVEKRPNRPIPLPELTATTASSTGGDSSSLDTLNTEVTTDDASHKEEIAMSATVSGPAAEDETTAEATANDQTTASSTANDNSDTGIQPPQDASDQQSAGENNDDDSTEAVGKEEAAERDRDMLDGDVGTDNDTEPHEVASTPALAAIANDATELIQVDPTKPMQVTSMFKKLLSLGHNSGQVVVKLETVGDKPSPLSVEPPASVPSPHVGPSASLPALVRNGRMICNLPDHPIHAGATAVVAVVAGRTLTVANAGDSRAVLCRAGGVTFPLSYDHKPQQDGEMKRITNAGGFVNQFGRVNGNLNLSRSIGDLKYKQVPGIAPPDQMITAEPDIIQTALEDGDEFIVIGCDGIWDCLTNENAVAFVRERIDYKSPTEIGVEMLDEIISDDPRSTQGIGGDNMTIMIIDLQPHSRSGNPPNVAGCRPEASPATFEAVASDDEAKPSPEASEQPD